MLKNFFLLTWRNLVRKKGFSILNISGLAIGMSAAIFILLWIQDETGFDNFYKDKERIYQVWNKYEIEGQISCWNVTPKVMGKYIQKDYPEVEQVARVNYSFPILFSFGDKKLNVRGNIVDSSFLQLFSFPAIKGDIRNALNNPNSVVITEAFAQKMFGAEDPIGKVVKVDNTDDFKVSAVIKNMPSNSSFNFEFLLPWSYLRTIGGDDENWGNNSTTTYVKLKTNASVAALNPKLKTLRKEYDKEEATMETFLYPLTRVHLHGKFENGIETGGRIDIVKLFGIIAAFILLVACINFMNLSTARSEKRAKEVGIRKVVGAPRASLIAQFMGESIFISLLSACLAVLIVFLTLSSFNTLVDKKLFLDFNNPLFWIYGLAFVLITGLLAGSYPAIYLSSFRPIKVIKGGFKSVQASITPRKVLVVGQFTFAILLIIATLVIRMQIQKAQDRQNGYKKANLVYHFMEGDVQKNYTVIRNELMASGMVQSVSKTSAPITEGWSNTWGIEWKGKDPNNKTVIDRFCADDAIVKTVGMELVAGRDIDLANHPADSNAAIINESSVKLMGFKNPIGEVVKDMGQEWTIVGVVKDFILTSPYGSTDPLFIAGAKGWFNVIHLRIADKVSTAQAIPVIEKIFNKYNPSYPFNYRFVDEEYSKKFDNERRTGKLATLFALFTIVISCLGLFGLASYMAENRIKEIGVRKVMGASVTSITGLLSYDFLKLVLVSFILAAPLGYWGMHTWLQQFSYRTDISWWIFGISGGGAVLIALLTVSYQAIKAAVANPVKSLRTE